MTNETPEQVRKLFVAMGFRVFPLIKGAKVPAINHWNTAGEEEIAKAFDATPDCNMAVKCGKTSGGLVILDFEAEADFRAFFNNERVLESTLVVKTPHGGIHVYLTSDDEVRRKIRVSEDHPLDILGEGGYAVAPGSTIDHTKCGKCGLQGTGTYEIISSVVTAKKVVALSDTIQKRCKGLGWRVKESKRFDAETVARGVGQGERDESAFNYARHLMFTAKLDPDTTWVELQRWNHLNRPPLDAAQLRKCFLSAQKYPYPAAQQEQGQTETDTTKKTDRQALAWETAKRLLAEDRYATLNGTEEIRVYRDGFYQAGGELWIKKRVQEEVDPLELNNHLVEEVIGHIKRSTYVDHEVFYAPGPHIVVVNGTLNVETGELKPHTPEHYSLSKLPVKFDPSLDCPAFKKFLSEVLYPEDIPVIQEWFGYCLWRGYPAQAAMLLVGGGSNGKSTLISVLKALLGIENISSVSLQELENNRFAKADLFGRFANLYADLPNSALKSVGTFKMITGGDPVRGENKFQRSFEFVNFAKLMFSCNVVPEVYEDTAAFFRRWIIIQFPNTFDGAKADRDLLVKLTAPMELSGIMNWALEGLSRLRANGWQFSHSKSTEEVKQDYIRRSSPMRAFLMDCTVLQPDGVIPKKNLFNAFVKYCAKMKLPTVTSDTFFKNLPQYFAGNPPPDSKEEVDGKRVLCYRGIAVRPEAEWGQPTREEPEAPSPPPRAPQERQGTLDLSSVSEVSAVF
jgi:P4 family phage/plasmid primase-like protien